MIYTIIVLFFILIFSLVNRFKYLGFKLEKFVLVTILGFSLISFFIPENINGQNTILWNLAINHNSVIPFLYLGNVFLNILLFLSISTIKNILALCMYFLNIIFYLAVLFATSSTTSSTYGITLILYSLSIIFILIYGMSAHPAVMMKKGVQFVTKVDKITPFYFSIYLAMIFIGTLMVIGGCYYLFSAGRNDHGFYIYIIDLIAGVAFIISSVLSLIPNKRKMVKNKAI